MSAEHSVDGILAVAEAADNGDVRHPGMVADMLRAYAKRIEADESAAPVAHAGADGGVGIDCVSHSPDAADSRRVTPEMVDWLIAYQSRLIVNGLHPEDARLWMKSHEFKDFDYTANAVDEADASWNDHFANPDDDGPVDFKLSQAFVDRVTLDESGEPPVIATGALAAQGQGEALAYFAADPAYGDFITHETLGGAIGNAATMLVQAQDDATDSGWTDEPPQICYGVVLGRCVEKEGSRRPALEGSDFAEMVDFRLTEPSAIPASPAGVPDIAVMVNRFLGWALPKDFAPDAGISYNLAANINQTTGEPYPNTPSGTNLFTAKQAEQMFRYVLAAAPQPGEP